MQGTPLVSPGTFYPPGLNKTHSLINSMGRDPRHLASRFVQEDKVDMATKAILFKEAPLPFSSKIIQAGAALSNSPKLRALPGGETIVAALATMTYTADTVSRHLEGRGRKNRGPKTATKKRLGKKKP